MRNNLLKKYKKQMQNTTKKFQVMVEVDHKNLMVIVVAQSLSQVAIKLHQWAKQTYPNQPIKFDLYRSETVVDENTESADVTI